MLIKARTWARKYFAPESQPAKNTLHNWVKSGAIEGQLLGGLLYIEDKPPSAMSKQAYKTPEKLIEEPANPLKVGRFTLRQTPD